MIFQLRELYAYSTTKNITKSQHFNECFQLLNFQSKDQFCKKLSAITKILDINTSPADSCTKELKMIHSNLTKFLTKLEDIDSITEITQSLKEQVHIGSASSRQEFKKVMFHISISNQ